MKFRNKSKYFQEDVKIARIARAMGHPARIAVLRMLSLNEACGFTEITEELPLAASTVSQHLTELKRAGLIRSNPELPEVKYSIDPGNWKTARKYLKEFTRLKTGKKK
jgi:ArsR family transcriptional regulator